MPGRLLGGTMICIGLVCAWNVSPPALAQDAERIQKLVGQLASEQFRIREYATKELDAIGEPALPALELAMKSDDMEVRRRAEMLHERISKRAANTSRIAPTLVELNAKDRAITEVIAELSKKSGYSIQLQGDATELAKRKITIETGKVPFWQALDMICEKGELAEVEVAVANPLPQNPIGGGIQIQPGIAPVPVPVPIQIQPAPAPIRIQPIQIQPAPAPIRRVPVKPMPVQEPAPEQPMKEVPAPMPDQPKQGAQKPVPAAPVVEAPVVQAVAQVQVQVQGQIQIAQPAQIIIDGSMPIQPNVNNNRTIVLADAKGKTKASPTHYEGAVRIRALSPERAKQFPLDGNIIVPIQANAEPKLQWQRIVSYQIDKAIDDRNQELVGVNGSLTQNDPNQDTIIINNGQVVRVIRRPFPGRGGVNGIEPNQLIPIRLKKGEQETSTIKEISGSITAQIRTAPEVLVRVSDVLTAKPVTITGKDGSKLKVVKIEKAENGEITVEFELGYTTETMPGVKQPIAPNGARTIAANNFLGLSLLDAKGNAWTVTRLLPRQQQFSGTTVSVIGSVAFRPAKDIGEPADFCFNGSSLSLVDIPFTLKDVPVK